MSNAFKCPNCGAFTKHIEITARECFALGCKWDKERGKKSNSILNVYTSLFASAYTLSGLGKVVTTLTGLKAYKCCECGMVAIRKADGEIDSIEYMPPKNK